MWQIPACSHSGFSGGVPTNRWNGLFLPFSPPSSPTSTTLAADHNVSPPAQNWVSKLFHPCQLSAP